MLTNLDAVWDQFSSDMLTKVPKASVKTVNDLAFVGQRYTRNVNMPKRFDLKTDFIKSGVVVEQATLSAPIARVGTKDFFMRKQEDSLTATPDGEKIAVPLSVDRDSRGMIRKRDRPKQIMARAGMDRGFIMKVRGRSFIVARKDKETLEFKYLLKSSVFVPKRFFFGKDMTALIEREAELHWLRNLSAELNG